MRTYCYDHRYAKSKTTQTLLQIRKKKETTENVCLSKEGDQVNVTFLIFCEFYNFLFLVVRYGMVPCLLLR